MANILPWPPGDPNAVHSHVSFDGGHTLVPRNMLTEQLPLPAGKTSQHTT
jgi:hypothetical protein